MVTTMGACRAWGLLAGFVKLKPSGATCGEDGVNGMNIVAAEQ
jgi:hypothetical protein